MNQGRFNGMLANPQLNASLLFKMKQNSAKGLYVISYNLSALCGCTNVVG
jgi:hypothetical protein